MRVHTVDRRPIGPWDEMAIHVHRDLDAGVPELLLYEGQRLSLLNQQTRVGVPEIM